MWNHDLFGGPCICNLFLPVLSGLEVRWPRISIAGESVFLRRRPSVMPTISLSSMSFDRRTAVGQQAAEYAGHRPPYVIGEAGASYRDPPAFVGWLKF